MALSLVSLHGSVGRCRKCQVYRAESWRSAASDVQLRDLPPLSLEITVTLWVGTGRWTSLLRPLKASIFLRRCNGYRPLACRSPPPYPRPSLPHPPSPVARPPASLTRDLAQSWEPQDGTYLQVWRLAELPPWTEPVICLQPADCGSKTGWEQSLSGPLFDPNVCGLPSAGRALEGGRGFLVEELMHEKQRRRG